MWNVWAVDCRLGGGRGPPQWKSGEEREREAIYVNPFVGSRRCRKMCPILQYRQSNLYLTDRKETMTIYPHSTPCLQIRPSLVHPFLPQDLYVPCKARASCYFSINLVKFYEVWLQSNLICRVNKNKGSILLRDQDGRENETTYCLFESFKYNHVALLISHSSPTLFSIDHAAHRSSPYSRMPHLNIPPSIICMWA